MTNRSPVETVHVFPSAAAKWLAPVMPHRTIVELDDAEAFRRAVADIDVLVAHHPPRGMWAEASRIRLIHASGAGVDDILPAVGLRSGALVANASGIHLPAMSEWIVGALLAANKQFERLARQQRDRIWRPTWRVGPLAGSTVCILGLGAIGADVVRLLQPFGVRVVGTRRTPSEVPGVEQVFGPEHTIEAMTGADALVVLLPRTSVTSAAVGGPELDAMADRAIVVDVSRGGIVDVDAVVDRLTSGKLSAAVLDVWDPEPLPAESPYWDVPGLFLTPHTAGSNTGYLRALAERVEANIVCLERSEPLISPVSRQHGY